jgi:hypothetical protein
LGFRFVLEQCLDAYEVAGPRVSRMTIDVLLGSGVQLPACRLAFGMPVDEFHAALAGIAEPRNAFACRGGWAERFSVGGLDVSAGGDEAGTVQVISVSRRAEAPPGAEPVSLDDIDLFGWPVDELFAALRDAGHDVRDRGRGQAWINGQIWLLYGPPPTPYAYSLSLYAPRPR